MFALVKIAVLLALCLAVLGVEAANGRALLQGWDSCYGCVLVLSRTCIGMQSRSRRQQCVT